MSDTPFTTTSGRTYLKDGKVVIAFAYLDRENTLHRIVLDVDAYAVELARDLCAAISEQRNSEGIV